MNLSQLGEQGLIQMISKRFQRNLNSQTVGIGDDAAVIPWDETSSLLVTTDMLIEDSHFLRNRITPQDLGHKSLAVNLSDIAAMGGTPSHAFLSLGLPIDLSVKWIDAFLDGFEKLANLYQVQLLGGDTTQSKKGIIIDVAVHGKIDNDKIKLRSAARPDDLVCVTSNLGDSSAGLRCLLEQKTSNQVSQHLMDRHHHPEPQVREGQWLSQFSAVHAMMDISDGLHQTMAQINQSSNCGAEIFLDQLPVSENLKKASLHFGWNALTMAAAGGEDYALALTIAPNEFEKINDFYRKEFSRPLYSVGKITEPPQVVSYFLHQKRFPEPITSWTHFS